MSKVKLGDEWYELAQANVLIAQRLGLVVYSRPGGPNHFAMAIGEEHDYIGPVPRYTTLIDTALDLPLAEGCRWSIEMPDEYVCGVVSIRDFDDPGAPAKPELGDFEEVSPGSGKDDIAPTMCSLWWAHMAVQECLAAQDAAE